MATTTESRPGSRAQVRYVRMSASKVRVVLDLIRGKHVIEASQILGFSERGAAEVVGKGLRSAVANATHNEEIPVDELFVSACYADEGPSLRRYRPRARGRAGRIRKQTCHITIEVQRYSTEELDEQRNRAELRGATSARSADTDRRRRVARSRQAEQPEAPAVEEPTTAETVAEDTADAEAPATEAPVAESAAEGAPAPSDEAAADPVADTVESGTDETEETS
ncbi:MAG: 50S ribosomal protein L22 [Acidimicrobiales bacterium]